MVHKLPKDTEEEAIEIANDITYGLSAVVQTRDIGRAEFYMDAKNVCLSNR